MPIWDRRYNDKKNNGGESRETGRRARGAEPQAWNRKHETKEAGYFAKHAAQMVMDILEVATLACKQPSQTDRETDEQACKQAG
eukprot:5109347-Pleurochrysis_carterae.AAC.5